MARWTAIDRSRYQVDWNGVTWRLEATPKARYPWVLYNRDGERQEVGPADVAGAQARSEFWLIVGDLQRGGRNGMGSKHTGESDTQTDHVGKGSDGHTTESGSDR